MTEDKNKGITITYNHLNLPVKVTFDSNEEITWTYDAAGVKLRKYTDDGQGNTTEKNYVGGIEYIKGANGYKVEAIYHSEGRVLPTDAEGKYQFEYTLKDHLGNARVTFSDLNNDATVDETEILETNHYYPFGMLHQPSSIVTGSSNAYKYNGKELNTDFDLGWLDYGARWYDASIARWSAVDPLTEKYIDSSPYHFVGNNPIKNLEIDGRSFTPESWKYIISLLDGMDKKREEISTTISEFETELKDNNISERKRKTLRRKLNRAETEQENLENEFKDITDELVELVESDQVYNIYESDEYVKRNDFGQVIERGGGAEFNLSTGEFDLIIPTSANGTQKLGFIAHELKHASQFERGTFSSGPHMPNEYLEHKNFLYDKYDEVEAYARGSFFGKRLIQLTICLLII